MHGIGAGVAYLHDRGIVHRDLKPGNIFSDEGLVKIGDYGLSKFISASRRSGQTESVGTVHYMAPEVANGRYGKEIDIYALGIMLYEMLTGHVPFEGESVGEVLMKHLTAEPDVSVLAEPYRTVLARALTKDPEKRFRTVSQMLALLPQPALPQVLVNPQATKPAPEAILVGEPIGRNGMHVGPAVVAAQVVPEEEEPIWRAVREAWRRFPTVGTMPISARRLRWSC
jgi:serine/threonine protein kinase